MNEPMLIIFSSVWLNCLKEKSFHLLTGLSCPVAEITTETIQGKKKNGTLPKEKVNFNTIPGFKRIAKENYFCQL